VALSSSTAGSTRQPHFSRRVLRFAAPAGLVAAGATFGGYALARAEPGVSLTAARTTTTILLFAVAVWVVSILARPLVGWRAILVAARVASFVVIAVAPGAREFFGLELPRLIVLFAAVGVASIADFVLEAGWRLTGWIVRHRASPPRDGTFAPGDVAENAVSSTRRWS